MVKIKEPVRKVKRSLEERTEAQRNKLEELEQKLKDKENKKIWVSDFRVKKSELNKTKIGVTDKLQQFVDWVYAETGVYAVSLESDCDSEESKQ